jgi:hypothetical protein
MKIQNILSIFTLDNLLCYTMYKAEFNHHKHKYILVFYQIKLQGYMFRPQGVILRPLRYIKYKLNFQVYFYAVRLRSQPLVVTIHINIIYIICIYIYISTTKD